MIAYCGLDCSKCDVFVATKNNDRNRIVSILNQWKDQIGFDYNESDLNGCKGCKSDMVISYCSNCDIEKCANSKEISTCSECSDYKCEKIKKIYGEI